MVDEQVAEKHCPISTIYHRKGEFYYFIKFQVPLLHSFFICIDSCYEGEGLVTIYLV